MDVVGIMCQRTCTIEVFYNMKKLWKNAKDNHINESLLSILQHSVNRDHILQRERKNHKMLVNHCNWVNHIGLD